MRHASHLDRHLSPKDLLRSPGGRDGQRDPVLQTGLLGSSAYQQRALRHLALQYGTAGFDGRLGQLLSYLALFATGIAAVIAFYGLLILCAVVVAGSAQVAAGGPPQTAVIWATGGMFVLGIIQLLRFALSELPSLVKEYLGEHRRLAGLAILAAGAVVFLLV